MLSALSIELRGDFGADLIAAGADAGTDGGMESGGIATEARLHGGCGFGGDAGGGATPSGMDGGDGAVGGIDQQDGDAIGGLDGDDRAGRVFEQRIAFPENSGAAFGGNAGSGVDLLEGGETGEGRRDIHGAGAEAVKQPREGVEFADAVDVPGVLVKGQN